MHMGRVTYRARIAVHLCLKRGRPVEQVDGSHVSTWPPGETWSRVLEKLHGVFIILSA